MAIKKTATKVIEEALKPEKVKPINKNLITVYIKEGDVETTLTGEDLIEILSTYKPAKINVKTVITVSKGDKSFVKVYNVHQAKRLLNNPINIMLLNRYAIEKLN